MSVKIPQWQILLSYFYRVVLEKKSSCYNPNLELCLSNGRLQLNAQTCTYSYEDKYTTFAVPFKELQFSEATVNKVLLLGTGLASVPQMLEQIYQVNANYTCIEIDDVIIDLAKHYLADELLDRINFICADAFDYVNALANKPTFDLIIVDVFIDNITPNKFKSKAFLKKLNHLLQLNGKILFNLLYNNSLQKKEFDHFYKGKVIDTFKETYFIETRGNRLLIISKTIS